MNQDEYIKAEDATRIYGWPLKISRDDKITNVSALLRQNQSTNCS